MRAIQPVQTGQGTIVPVTGDYILEHLDALKANQIPVYQPQRNSAGVMRADPADPASALKLPLGDRGKKLFLIDKEWKHKLFAAADPFEAELEPLLDRSPRERADAVRSLKTVLVDLKHQEAEPMVKAKAIMDTVSQAFLLNKASLKGRVADVTVHEKSVAKDTEAIVGTALEMADDPDLVAGLFAGFRSLSNGQTVNHVLRVFATYSGFLKHYNVQHRNRLPQTLRKVFPSVYLDRYRRLLPKLDTHLMTSDQLLQLPYFEPHQTREFALGAFLHDIGKVANLDYFESDAGYDATQIRQHVFVSVGLILMNYGTEHEGARLLAGDHHNALGHSGGYGVTRLEREKGLRTPAEPVRVLSSSPDGFVSGQALGWLPTEMLAVADVYDAMIDDSRSYKKPMTPSEAVVFLEDTMAAQGKLDPVLVDLYTDYLRTQGVAVPSDRGFQFRSGH